MNSDFRNSISFLNLYQNFKKLHQDLIRLQQFIELNETGFSKVVKKWDKRSKSHTKELFISTAVSVQPVFHRNEINELSDLVTQSLFDIESIMDSDYTCLNNYSLYALNSLLHLPSILLKEEGIDVDKLINHNEPKSEFVRHSSIGGTPITNNEVDELYASFVNIATIKDPDMSLLARWIDKVNGSSLASTSDTRFNPLVKSKVSKIFLLSIANLKISDSFLESFLNLVNYDVDFTIINDDFNNNKTIIHECCSIAPTSHHESHVVINNGVRVVNLNDSINHSRNFIVEYMMKNLTQLEVRNLLTRRDFNGRNCLHYAAQNNRGDLIELLLSSFPKEHIDDVDNDSMSPLLLAIKNGYLNIVKILVKSGSNPFPETSKDTLQYLPINYACKFGDYKILEYLLSNESSKNLMKMLVNQRDVEGLLPLHVVSRAGHYKLIELLIQYGAEVNKLDGFNKWTPIFYSASEGHVKTTQELIKYGAKLNVVDGDGFNVLYYSVLEGHIEVINELLSYDKRLCGERRGRQLHFPQTAAISTSSSSTTTGGAEIGDTTPMTGISTITTNGSDFSTEAVTNREDDSDDSDPVEKQNVDSIPDLQLPPPILPLRRYGHNFLEQKVLIELVFPHDDLEFIKLYNTITDLKPGRITLTSSNSDIVPRNILLPLEEKAENGGGTCVFQTDVDSLTDFRIDFEIFPKFGTRLIAKTTALSFSNIDTTSPEVTSVELPLFDLRLRNIGLLRFNFQIIFPFSGTLLETSKFDTYWKSSTSFVNNKHALKLNAAGGLSPKNFLSPKNNASHIAGNVTGNVTGNVASNSFAATAGAGAGSGGAIGAAHLSTVLQVPSSSIVTATSLSGEYLRIKVCLLNDATPVVCPHWAIAITEKIDLYLPNLSLEQLTSVTDELFDYSKVLSDISAMTVKDIQLIKKLLRIIYLPLDIILDVLSPDINLNLELVFPSAYELEALPFVSNVKENLNTFIDFTLDDVFKHMEPSKRRFPGSASRSIIFLSSNSLICKILNWKQPNFPVFLIMNGITYNGKLGKFEKRSTNGMLIHQRGVKEKRYLMRLKNRQDVIIRSIKEAVNFTVSNNLFGLITSMHLLELVPKLIPLIRSQGLILVASSDFNEQEEEEEELEEELFKKELDSYKKTEINGLRFDDVLSFKEDITI